MRPDRSASVVKAHGSEERGQRILETGLPKPSRSCSCTIFVGYGGYAGWCVKVIGAAGRPLRIFEGGGMSYARQAGTEWGGASGKGYEARSRSRYPRYAREIAEALEAAHEKEASGLVTPVSLDHLRLAGHSHERSDP